MITFTLRREPDQRLDLSPLIPEKLAGKSLREIAAVELQTTRERVTVGEVFKILLGDAASLRFVGGSERFDWLGHAMSSGEIVIEGHAGAQAGRLMTGGSLTVRGNVGPFAASGLSGGHMEIAGDAGDHLRHDDVAHANSFGLGSFEVSQRVSSRR